MTFELAQTCMAVDIGLTRGECAAWVQAWGSIAAIGAGAWGVWWSAGRQRSYALAEEVRKLSTLATGLFFCVAITKELLQSSDAGLPIDDPEQRLRQQVEALESIKPLDIPDWKVAAGLLHALDGYAQYKRQNIGPAIWPDIGATVHRSREPWLNRALFAFEVAERIARDSIEERGATPPDLTFRLNDQVLHQHQ